MDTLVAGAHVAEGAPQIFLSNRLVVILPADNPAALAKLEDLASSDIKLVLGGGGSPRREVCTSGTGPDERSVRERLSRIRSLQMLYQTKIMSSRWSQKSNLVKRMQASCILQMLLPQPELKTIEIPAELNVIAEYPIATLTQSANSDLANAFIAYVLSSDGQAVLQKWGFAPPE